MALSPVEWLVIGAIVLVMVFWGPKKLPELARAAGRAKREFDTASNEAQQISKDIQTPMKDIAKQMESEATALKRDFETVAIPDTKAAQRPEIASASGLSKTAEVSNDDVLIRTAMKMGIPTEGKTSDEISWAIVTKVNLGTEGSK